MRTVLLCIGKLREAFWREAADEYCKRMGRFGGIEIIECPDLPEPKNASKADVGKLIDAEGALLLPHIKPRDHVVALCIEGKQVSSTDLAERIAALEGQGVARVVYVIGGSNGLANAVVARANERWSISKMTFPHQLCRVIVLEQLYRARKILAHEAYHK